MWKAVELAETRMTVNSVVNLYIDRQAVIKGITAYKVNSKLVNSCKAAVERLASNRKLHIYWVPGHVGETKLLMRWPEVEFISRKSG